MENCRVVLESAYVFMTSSIPCVSLLLSWHMHGLIPPANSNSLPATHWIPVNKQNDQNNISWGQLTYGLSVCPKEVIHHQLWISKGIRDNSMIFLMCSWYLLTPWSLHKNYLESLHSSLEKEQTLLIKRVLWMFFGCFLATNQLHDLHLLSKSWSAFRKNNCRVTTLDCKHFVSNSKDAKVLDMVTTLNARASFPMRRMRNKTSSSATTIAPR